MTEGNENYSASVIKLFKKILTNAHNNSKINTVDI